MLCKTINRVCCSQYSLFVSLNIAALALSKAVFSFEFWDDPKFLMRTIELYVTFYNITKTCMSSNTILIMNLNKPYQLLHYLQLPNYFRFLHSLSSLGHLPCISSVLVYRIALFSIAYLPCLLLPEYPFLSWYLHYPWVKLPSRIHCHAFL